MIAYFAARGDLDDIMVNHVLEIDEQGQIEVYALPGED